jgi:hypothetical protein
MQIDPEAGVLSGTPQMADAGVTRVAVQVADPFGEVDVQQFNLTVRSDAVAPPVEPRPEPQTPPAIEPVTGLPLRMAEKAVLSGPGAAPAVALRMVPALPPGFLIREVFERNFDRFDVRALEERPLFPDFPDAAYPVRHADAEPPAVADVAIDFDVGKRELDSIEIRWTEPIQIDTLPANAIYLWAAGPDGEFGTGDDERIHGRLTWDAEQRVLRFEPRGDWPAGPCRLVIAGRVADLAGNRSAGDVVLPIPLP